MDTQEPGTTAKSAEVAQNEPRCLQIAKAGVRTGADFANLMSALMSDIIEGRVTPQVGNSTCIAGRQLLRVVEMQYKYGTPTGVSGDRVLQLTQQQS